MSEFKGFKAGLKIEYMGPSRRKNIALFQLLEGFTYFDKKTGDEVEVFAGFITDGATIPSILWSLLPPWGNYGQAAVLHDYLLEIKKVKNGQFIKTVTRDEARQLFISSMKYLEVPTVTRLIIGSAVFVYDKYVLFKNKLFKSKN